MATTYFARWAAQGSGNGLSAGNEMTLAAACAAALPGDVVNLRGGTYTSFPTPARSGTSDSARITFQKYLSEVPIIDGGYGAAGGVAATPITGWQSVALGYANAGGSTYRATLATTAEIIHLWANDFYTGTNPLGLKCALWNMGRANGSFSAAGTNPNPDFRIHSYTGAAGENNNRGDACFDGKYQFRSNYDGLYGPAGTLDVRLNNDAPGGYTLYGAVGNRGLSMSGLSYLTFSGIQWRRWAKWWDLSGCTNITFQSCDCRYAGRGGVVFDNGSSNCKILACTLVGVGSMIGGDQDLIAIGNGSNNITVDGSVLRYWGHDGILCYPGSSAGHQFTNNEIGNGATGMNFVNAAANDTIGNVTVAFNTFHDCGQYANQGCDKLTHMGMEISKLANSVIRRNTFWKCGWGIWTSSKALGQGGGVSNTRIDHNTFVDCERDGIDLFSYNDGADGQTHDVLVRNNIIYAPSGGTAGEHHAGLYVNLWRMDANWYNNRVQNNLFFAPGSGYVMVKDASAPTGSYPSIASAQTANPTAMSGNIGGDPVFVSYSGGDFSLQSSSPAIGAGVVIPGETYVGTPDIGRYEYQGGASTPPVASITTVSPASGSRSGSPAVLAVSLTGAGTPVAPATLSSFVWDFGDGVTLSGSFGGGSTTSTTHNFTSDGSFNVRFTVTDSNGLSATSSATVQVLPSAAANQITFASATASSYESTPAAYPPSAAIDGILSTATPFVDTGRWVSDPSAIMPHWWRGDMGNTFALTQIRFSCQKWDSGRSYTVTVETSTDGVSYQTVASGLASDSSPTGDVSHQWTTINLSPAVNARYVRLTEAQASDGSIHGGLWELQAFGTQVPGGTPGGGGGGGGTPYSGVVATDASSNVGAFAPSLAVDAKSASSRDPRSRWIAPGLSPQAFFVDLGTSKQISGVNIAFYHSRSGRLTTFDLAYSNSLSGPWTTPNVNGQAANGLTSAAGEWTNVIISPGVVARYLRINITATSPASYGSIWECQVLP